MDDDDATETFYIFIDFPNTFEETFENMSQRI